MRSPIVTAIVACMISPWPSLVTSFRLPRNFVPSFYDIRIALDDQPQQNASQPPTSFDGSVKIVVDCLEASDEIVLHATNLTIDADDVVVVVRTPRKMADDVSNGSSGVARHSSSVIKVISHEFKPDVDFLVLKLARKLIAGRSYEILMRYKGKVHEIGPNYAGLLYSTFVDPTDGQIRYHLRTQLESIGARQLFPCFDEPDLKAIFQVTVGRKIGHKSYSNMPLRRTVPMTARPGWEWDEFLPSTRMSTYLVAIVIGEFTEIAVTDDEDDDEPADESVDRQPISRQRLILRKTALESAKANYSYALEVMPRVLPRCEEILGLPYFLPKLDHAAVHKHGGGMENYGLIIYGEKIVIVQDPEDEARKQLTLEMIAHEDVHMWFGNLVTMKNWDMIWLNEGLTTFFASWILEDDDLGGEGSFDLLIGNKMNRAIAYDYQPGAMPMVKPLLGPSDVTVAGIFAKPDRIYSRGAAIVHMAYRVLGEECFLAGIRDYLSMFAFGNADENDLWYALENKERELCGHHFSVPGRLPSLSTAMFNWTHNIGVPVITVTRNYENGAVYLKQERFLPATHEEETDFSARPLWSIPITYTTSKSSNFDETEPKFWMNEEIEVLPTVEEGFQEDDWVIFNVQRSGYYLVNYDLDNWRAILNQLQDDPEKIHPTNRAQIISDSLMLCHAGLLMPLVCVALAENLKQETHFGVWAAATAHIHILRGTTESDADFKSFAESLAMSAATKIMAHKRHGGQVVEQTLHLEEDKVLHLLKDWMKHLRKSPSEGYITKAEGLWLEAIGAVTEWKKPSTR